MTPLPSADFMRSVQIDASAHPSSDVVLPPAASPPCVASRALSELCCVTPDLSHPTSCLPSHRDGFATRPSLRSAIKRDRFYEGSDSRRSHAARRVSPLTPPCLPAIPIPTTRSVRGSLSQSSQRPRSFQASPSSSRLATGTRRIGFVFLQTSDSLPAAPHLVRALPETQLPSATQSRHTMTGTCTPPTKRLHRRTGFPRTRE